MFKQWISGLALVAALVTVGAQAQSELDGAKAPEIIVSKLDASKQTVTNYRVNQLPAGLTTAELNKLSPAEQEARVNAFLNSAAKAENKISEEKVTAEKSELDQAGSTGATFWRYRRWGGGYYGGNFNYYYTNANYYTYRPYWGYNTYNRSYYDCYGYRPYYGYNSYYTVYGYRW